MNLSKFSDSDLMILGYCVGFLTCLIFDIIEKKIYERKNKNDL